MWNPRGLPPPPPLPPQSSVPTTWPTALAMATPPLTPIAPPPMNPLAHPPLAPPALNAPPTWDQQQAFYQALPTHEVDWAALAQQWMAYKSSEALHTPIVMPVSNRPQQPVNSVFINHVNIPNRGGVDQMDIEQESQEGSATAAIEMPTTMNATTTTTPNPTPNATPWLHQPPQAEHQMVLPQWAASGSEGPSLMDGAARKKLPAWIRQGLEQMEREKAKKEEAEHRKRLREEKLNRRREEERKRLQKDPTASKFDQMNSDDDDDDDNDDEGNNEQEDNDRKAEQEEAEEAERLLDERGRHEGVVAVDEVSAVEVEKEGEESDEDKVDVPQTAEQNRAALEESKAEIAMMSKESVLHVMMGVLKQTMTELLLEVTRDEMASVCETTLKRCKHQQTVRRLNELRGEKKKRNKEEGLTTIAMGYGSNDEESDDDQSDEEDGDDESDVEAELRSKQRNFEVLSKDILANCERAEDNYARREAKWRRRLNNDHKDNDEDEHEDEGDKKKANDDDNHRSHQDKKSVKDDHKDAEEKHTDRHRSISSSTSSRHRERNRSSKDEKKTSRKRSRSTSSKRKSSRRETSKSPKRRRSRSRSRKEKKRRSRSRRRDRSSSSPSRRHRHVRARSQRRRQRTNSDRRRSSRDSSDDTDRRRHNNRRRSRSKEDKKKRRIRRSRSSSSSS